MSEPQPEDQSNHPEPGPAAERQGRVETLADEYLERLLRGETPDRQAFLAAHPDLADLLGPRLELVELMHRVARAQRPVNAETASLTQAAAPGERVLRIKCPHCGNGIQLVEPAAGEVTCCGCGSSFHVDPRSTTTYGPASLPRTVGKFEVLEQLGRGTFGTVYKARDPELQRLVAVKVPRAGSFATPEEEERFLREARAAAQLSHPGIVPVLEIAHDRGLPYIVSEYVEGLTLADVLTARRPAFRESAELVAAVADALDYAHRQKIVHRDVKPSNLLLDAAGRPHVTDFGLARRGEGEITVTLDGQILGTPAYMSPEQAAGDQQRVDARSDVYSLGVVLYELLTGELPFRGNQRMLLHQVLHDEPRPPRSLNDRIPRDLETICLKAMAKTPARRYGSALEMADDLRRFLTGEPIRARPVGRAEKLTGWARRNPTVATLTTVVAFLLVTVTVVTATFAFYQAKANRDLSDERDKAERSQREAEVRAASAAVDLDLKHCQDGEIEYGVLRLARTLGTLPPHAAELRQCVEMNLLAWAQEIQPLGPTFQYDGAETTWELSADGLTVLTGGADGTARLWDAFTGEVRATLRGHRGEIASVGFSQNGRVAMTVGEDRTVRLWEVSNGQARSTTAEHPTSIEKPLLSPDGRRLLTMWWHDWVRRVSLWDTSTGRRIADLSGHAGDVHDAAFSPDGQRMLTGGGDKTARLWSADSGAALATFPTPTGAVARVAFSPEGDVAATLEQHAGTTVVRWWDLRRQTQIGPPCTTSSSPFNEWYFRALRGDVAVLDGPGAGAIFYLQGMEHAIEGTKGSRTGVCKADETCFVDPMGRVYDRSSGKRRSLPPGRKFSNELVPFAIGGRFIVLQSDAERPSTPLVGPDLVLIDLATEKAIGAGANFRMAFRAVPDRQTFIALSWSSPRYVPAPGTPLDAEVAQLFAEVVTCHELDPAGTAQPLDEATWDQRRKQLAGRLDGNPAPFIFRRVASDPWYWLRRQVDRAKSEEDRLKYLDRLIGVQPTWQNYDRRATEQAIARHFREATLDSVAAGKRAGAGYWHKSRTIADPLLNWQRSRELVEDPNGSRDDYDAGLQLAEALTREFPASRYYRLMLGMALYRLGRHAEALPPLESSQREWQKIVASQAGEFFLMGPRALLLYNRLPLVYLNCERLAKGIAFLAMTHHRLGDHARARRLLNELRRLGDMYDMYGQSVARSGKDYGTSLREAEALIEGRPQPKK